MSVKSFYVIGVAAVAIGAAATVFAADTPAARPAAAPSTKAAPVRVERRQVRMVTPTFVDVDSNHDGAISPAEFDAYREAHKGNLREEAPGMQQGGRGPGGWGGPPMMRMNRHFGGRGEGPGGMALHGGRALDLLDTNNDGKLSFDEMIAPLKRHFDRMDANHDGTLSEDELQKGHEKVGRDLPPPPPGQ